MEQEKLSESKRTFDEDKERYKQYIEQLGIEAQAIEEDVKAKVAHKNNLNTKIKQLSEEIHQKSSECGKIDDQFALHKTSRDFIKEIGNLNFSIYL
jgi:chromosome segregation ATPase